MEEIIFPATVAAEPTTEEHVAIMIPQQEEIEVWKLVTYIDEAKILLSYADWIPEPWRLTYPIGERVVPVNRKAGILAFRSKEEAINYARIHPENIMRPNALKQVYRATTTKLMPVPKKIADVTQDDEGEILERYWNDLPLPLSCTFFTPTGTVFCENITLHERVA